MPDEDACDFRLLVVDESADAREGCASMLAQLFPDRLHVDLVENNEQAIQRLREGGYHVILADHRLASLDGVALLTAAARLHPAAARILLAAPAELDAARAALDRAHGHAVILKPLRLVALREALRHVAGVQAS